MIWESQTSNLCLLLDLWNVDFGYNLISIAKGKVRKKWYNNHYSFCVVPIHEAQVHEVVIGEMPMPRNFKNFSLN